MTHSSQNKSLYAEVYNKKELVDLSDDNFLIKLEISLRHWTPIFCILSPDGTLQMRGLQFLRTEYSGQFRIIGASSIPTVEELNKTIVSTESKTGEIETAYQGLLRFMGFKSWSWILIISNTESLSADQALALRECLNERESDKRCKSLSKSLYEALSDWPRSIIFVLKKGEFLSDDLLKFVHGVIDPEAATDDEFGFS